MNLAKVQMRLLSILGLAFLCLMGCVSFNGTAKPGQGKAEHLKAKLSPIQYEVTQEGGTEPAYQNSYWNHFEAGIYVDVVTGEPLFSSLDKFDAGTGWPAFKKPLVKKNIVLKDDSILFFARTEIRSLKGNSHLGHLFADGPPPSHKHFCVNSAALRFIPVNALEKEGYEQFKALFYSKE